MDFAAFKASLSAPQPPEDLGPALRALWWDARGDWEKAHDHAQERDDDAGSRVHAYLHRKEGDQPNANYWYRRSGTTPSTLSLDEEWEELARSLLAKG